jgi:hypothetical protein
MARMPRDRADDVFDGISGAEFLVYRRVAATRRLAAPMFPFIRDVSPT